MEKRKRSIDMLSRLPDEVLCHILSFLPTNLSVRTSVLAKRWRFLWAQVPNLIFYRSRLDNINRVIMLHESKIVDTFRLSYVKVCAYQLETLLIYPIRRGVRNLYLEFDYGFEEKIACTLSRFLFTCKTLVDLRLVNCGVIPSTGELFLPSLKKLNLTFVELADDESLPRLISGCPVLEDLTVHDCFRKEQKHSVCFTCISSPTIKTLKVDFSDGDDDMPDKTLIIDVPALVYLKLSCYDLEYVKSLTKTMASLSEAEITLDPNSHRCDIDCTEHGRSIEFLSCLSHVRHLKFSNDCGDPLFDIVGKGSMPKFVNLTTLKLDLAVDWYNVVKFLEVADNLQVLFINLYKIPPHKEPKRVPQCMLSRLRTVRMYSLSARQDGFDMVRYILMNAQVLERMEIYADYWSSDKEKLDALRRISLFERGSKSCQVAFN